MQLKTLPRLAPIRLLAMAFPLVLALGLVMAFHDQYGKHKLPLPYSPALDAMGTLVFTAGLLLLYAALVRWLERRPVHELELREAPRALGLGALLGFVLFSLVCLVFWGAGIARWSGYNGFAHVGSPLLMAAVAAVGEELLFRGVLFRVLEQCFGTLLAMLASAALFGLMHAGSPGATTMSTIAIALEAGLLLAAAYACSRNLWLVIGLHFAWNFTEGGVFGTAVSGVSTRGVVDLAISQQAPALLSGGRFGPEASVIAVALCLLAAIGFLAAALRSGQWRPLSLRLVLD